MACDRRLTTLRYGRDHYVSRLPRHTPRLSSLASVAHPSLHPLVPEARRRRGEGQEVTVLQGLTYRSLHSSPSARPVRERNVRDERRTGPTAEASGETVR